MFCCIYILYIGIYLILELVFNLNFAFPFSFRLILLNLVGQLAARHMEFVRVIIFFRFKNSLVSNGIVDHRVCIECVLASVPITYI